MDLTAYTYKDRLSEVHFEDFEAGSEWSWPTQPEERAPSGVSRSLCRRCVSRVLHRVQQRSGVMVRHDDEQSYA